MISFFLILILTILISFFIFNLSFNKFVFSKYKSKKFLFLIIFFISSTFLGTLLVYNYVGYPNLTDKLLKENKLKALKIKEKTKNKISNIKRNINFIENKLLDKPNDLGLMLILASNYAMIGEFDTEIDVLKRILNIKQNTMVQSLLAQALLRKNNGIVDLKIKNLISKIIEKNPKNEGANYILGLYHKQIGDNKKANKIWTDLLKTLKPNNPFISLIQNNLKQMSN